MTPLRAHRLALSTLLVLLALALAACASEPAPPAREGATMKAGPNAQSLLGTEWRLEDLGGGGTTEDSKATIGFPEAGKVAGNGSCNRFAGKVECGDGTIRFGPLVSTKMACAPAASDQETKYLKALEGATRVAADGPDLLVYSKERDQPL